LGDNVKNQISIVAIDYFNSIMFLLIFFDKIKNTERLYAIKKNTTQKGGILFPVSCMYATKKPAGNPTIKPSKATIFKAFVVKTRFSIFNIGFDLENV